MLCPRTQHRPSKINETKNFNLDGDIYHPLFQQDLTSRTGISLRISYLLQYNKDYNDNHEVNLTVKKLLKELVSETTPYNMLIIKSNNQNQ